MATHEIVYLRQFKNAQMGMILELETEIMLEPQWVLQLYDWTRLEDNILSIIAEEFYDTKEKAIQALKDQPE